MIAFVSALLTVAALLACALFLAMDARTRGKMMILCAAFSSVVMALFYGYAYALNDGISVETIAKALSNTFRTFVGVQDFDAILRTPLAGSVILRSVFWITYFVGVYFSASAVLSVLGGRVLVRIREWMLRRRSLILVYGATPETVGLVRSNRERQGLVFVCEQGVNMSQLTDSMGGVAYPGGAAHCASPAFLKTLGYDGKRTMDVYCVSNDPGMNLRYAETLLNALKTIGAESEGTSLFLLGVPEARAEHMGASEGRYGYGSLFACERHELIARLAIRSCPPWTRLTFDDQGRATKDFRAVIVGFGQTGRSILNELIKNGQMEGSTFHAEVFDPRIKQLSGPLQACNPELLKAYDIALHGDGVQSLAFYERLAEHVPDVIVLCTGDERKNGEYALELERYYASRPEKPAILQCGWGGVVIDGGFRRVEDIDVRRMDSRAMILNHVYCKGSSPEADWRECDPFSRASSRASADFYPAFLWAAGITEEEALAGHWPPSPKILENLARTEHLRWCAFHLVMGYSPMSRGEYEDRAARYHRGEKLRVSRNTQNMTHACLVPWEELDEISAWENAATGKSLDYKAMDRDNVVAIPDIIRQQRQAEQKAPKRRTLWEREQGA